MNNFKNKVAAVTGAGSGIGRSLALQLAERGCHLALSDIDMGGLEATRQAIVDAGHSVRVTLEAVDVSKREEVEAWSDKVAADHGAVNLLVNNAGVALGVMVKDASYEDMHWLMDINFWGVMHGVTAFLPQLRRAEEAHIVNVSSVYGLFTTPMNGIYSASKFAVRGVSDAMDQELAALGIRVSCAFPAGIKTDIARNARVQVHKKSPVSAQQLQQGMEKLLVTTPEQAAGQILAGVAKKRPRILVGKGSWRMDMLSRLFPVSYRRFFG